MIRCRASSAGSLRSLQSADFSHAAGDRDYSLTTPSREEPWPLLLWMSSDRDDAINRSKCPEDQRPPLISDAEPNKALQPDLPNQPRHGPTPGCVTLCWKRESDVGPARGALANGTRSTASGSCSRPRSPHPATEQPRGKDARRARSRDLDAACGAARAWQVFRALGRRSGASVQRAVLPWRAGRRHLRGE